eukprot:2306161-Rhodomonas_salina.1
MIGLIRKPFANALAKLMQTITNLAGYPGTRVGITSLLHGICAHPPKWRGGTLGGKFRTSSGMKIQLLPTLDKTTC